jgi:hypothetical protein
VLKQLAQGATQGILSLTLAEYDSNLSAYNDSLPDGGFSMQIRIGSFQHAD